MNEKAGSHQEFTRESFRWAVSAVSTFADYWWSYISVDVKKQIEKTTGKWMKEQSAIDAMAVELFKKDPKAARTFLTDYCKKNVESARDAWWALFDELLRKYDMMQIYDLDTMKRVRPAMPEDYVRIVGPADKPGSPGEFY